MSDRFYDFDKDAAFDEVYSDKVVKKPSKKEYEIEIPMPKSELKSTMPQKQAQSQKPAKAKKKKMSKGKIALATIGIILSCLIVYLGSFLLTILNWHKLPSFKEAEKSSFEDVKKTDEYVVISDDGETVEVIPMYKDTQPEETTTSTEDETADNSEEDEENSENEENTETGDEDTSSGTSSDNSGETSSDEVIDV